MNEAEQVATDWVHEFNWLVASLPGQIDRIELLVAALMVPLGVISLLYGYRVFKGIVVVYSAVAGAAAGWAIVSGPLGHPNEAWIGVVVGAALLAVLAWPLVNFFVGIWGAIAGGIVGVAVVRAAAQTSWSVVGAGLGVIIGAVLAVLVFRLMITITTSVLGSALAVVGVVSLVYHVERIRTLVQPQVETAPFVLPLIVAGPALVGIFYQLHQTEGRTSKQDRKKAGDE